MIHPDVLSEALNSIRLHCFVPGLSEMTAPWGISFGRPPSEEDLKHLETVGLPAPPNRRPPIHGSFFAVVRGSCWLEFEAHDVRLQLQGGDVVVLARGGPHVLRDQPTSPVRNVLAMLGPEHAERFRGLRGGGGGASTTFIHGVYSFREEQDNPLIAALPPAIVVRGEEGRAVPWLEDTVKSLIGESLDQRPGWQNVVTHLAHVLFAHAVRAHFASQPEEGPGSWFRALSDPDLSAALAAIHADVAAPWTVASLAELASMSRSAFAARFAQAVGQPPLEYLTQARMRKARELLRDGRTGVKAVAAAVGYANESAFSNAFKRITGTAPAAYRRGAAG